MSARDPYTGRFVSRKNPRARKNMAGRPGKHGMPRYEAPRPEGKFSSMSMKQLKAYAKRGSVGAKQELLWRKKDRALRAGMEAPASRVALRKPSAPRKSKKSGKSKKKYTPADVARLAAQALKKINSARNNPRIPAIPAHYVQARTVFNKLSNMDLPSIGGDDAYMDFALFLVGAQVDHLVGHPRGGKTIRAALAAFDREGHPEGDHAYAAGQAHGGRF